MHEVTIDKLTPLVKHTIECGLVPSITASPGVGKSDLMRELAKNLNLKVIDFRLSQCDPTDLNGFPVINEERTRSGYAPPSVFPMKGDALPIKSGQRDPENEHEPAHYDGWLLFLDEMTSAPITVQAASYKLVLDRMIGEFDLHDKAIVNRMSTAMQSRLIHYQAVPDIKSWIKWANLHNIDFRIKSFVQFRPELLHNFDPNHSEHTFPCPRTWEFLSLLITSEPVINNDVMPMVSGTIGQGAALEFAAYSDIFQRLPTIDTILARPDYVDVPSEPDVLYAISGLISKHASTTNLDGLMKFVTRLPMEFQAITLQAIMAADETFMNEPAVDKWVTANYAELI